VERRDAATIVYRHNVADYIELAEFFQIRIFPDPCSSRRLLNLPQCLLP
jgi:hypothetical protein